MSSEYQTRIEEAADFWFLNSLVTIVADLGMTGGAFSIYRQTAPAGFATPYHTHETYSEGFYVLEGNVTFFRDGQEVSLAEGGFIYLPGIQPHGFRVSGNDAATMMIVSSQGSTFGAFVREMGLPATTQILPEPTRADVDRLRIVSEKYGSKILGPLPGVEWGADL